MKIGSKEAELRRQREASLKGPPYRSQSSSVTASIPVEGSVPIARECPVNRPQAPPKPKRKRAPKGTFDRKAYQRELMRKRRAAQKAGQKEVP